MLMMIGPVKMEVQPFNLTDYSHTHGATYAEKPVMGVRPPLEYVGGAPEAWMLKAALFPDRFGGGHNLAALSMLRASGAPQYMIRGDGSLMGWVILENIAETATYLNAGGVGQKIEIEISLKRSDPPSLSGYISSMSSMFAGIFA